MAVGERLWSHRLACSQTGEGAAAGLTRWPSELFFVRPNSVSGIRTLHELQVFETGGSYIWRRPKTKASHSLHRPCTASLPTFQTSSTAKACTWQG